MRVAIGDDVARVCEALATDAQPAGGAGPQAGCMTDFRAIASWLNAHPTLHGPGCSAGPQQPPSRIRDCLAFPVPATLHDLTIVHANFDITAGALTWVTLDLQFPSLGTGASFEGKMLPGACVSGSEWSTKMWWHP